MGWFDRKVEGLEERPTMAAQVTPDRPEEVVAVVHRKPNEYIFGSRYFAEWSEESAKEETEPWGIYDPYRKCKAMFYTDTRESAEKLIKFLEGIPGVPSAGERSVA